MTHNLFYWMVVIYIVFNYISSKTNNRHTIFNILYPWINRKEIGLSKNELSWERKCCICFKQSPKRTNFILENKYQLRATNSDTRYRWKIVPFRRFWRFPLFFVHKFLWLIISTFTPKIGTYFFSNWISIKLSVHF